MATVCFQTLLTNCVFKYAFLAVSINNVHLMIVDSTLGRLPIWTAFPPGLHSPFGQMVSQNMMSRVQGSKGPKVMLANCDKYCMAHGCATCKNI